MNHSGVRRFLRLAIVGGALLGVLRPAGAAAQSVEIYPGQNIQQVVNSYPAGTTFYLKAGVHRLQTITPRSGDRYIGEPGTVLSGARQLTSFSRSGAYWVATGQTQQGPLDYFECKPGYPRCGYPENLYFDGVPLRHVDSIGGVGPGAFFFDYATDRIYFWDDPTGRNVEASVNGQAFTGFATDVLISGLIVEKFATPIGQAAVQVGTRWTLQYSEVKLNHYAGVGTGQESKVLYNTIHHNGGFGLIGAGNYATIDSNEIAYNNFAGMNPYWGAGGTKFVLTFGLTIRNNNSHHNGGPGLWTDIGNIYTLYENNTVEDNERGGIFHELSYNATIRNNTARRNGTSKPFPYYTTGAGIEIVDSPNVEVAGNVLEDNWQGITALDVHRGWGTYGEYGIRNLNVHDNQVTSRLTDAGSGRTGIVDFDGWTAYNVGNNHFTGNRYTLLNPSGQYFMWGGERTLADWQASGNDVGFTAFAAPPVTSGAKYLSDMSFTQSMNGWGPAERDRSNGESGGGDGRTLTLNGVTYAKGIGVHANSQLRWQLGGQCTTFSAVVGVDDEVGSNGSVIFQVYVDGQFRYMTGVMTGSTPSVNVQVDVTGANELALYVHYGWDNINYDHADWADAKVTCR